MAAQVSAIPTPSPAQQQAASALLMALNDYLPTVPTLAHLLCLHTGWEWEAQLGGGKKNMGRWHFVVSLAHRQAGYQTGIVDPATIADLPSVTLAECEPVSLWVSETLEKPEFSKLLGDLAYDLDVASPGVFRQLTTPLELAFYQGWPVTVEEQTPSPELVAPAKSKGKIAKKSAKSPSLPTATLTAANDITMTLTLSNGEIQTLSMEALTTTHRVCLNPPLKKPTAAAVVPDLD
jgi:ribosome maturation factor RimP